jgi:molybdopterin molybdotransferase
MRRDLFARRLFESSDSILAPRLWAEVLGSIPHDFRAAVQVGSDAVERAGTRLNPKAAFAVLGALLLAVLLIVPVRRFALTFAKRDRLAGQPSRLDKAMAAAMITILGSAGPMLAALIERDGGDVIFPGIVRDEPDEIRKALLEPADIILVSGGSSVGQEDFAPNLLAELGEVAIHGIAMRPSSPTGMGQLQGRLVFLLPGNPVSCLCAYDFFAGRAIRAMGGRARDWPYRRVLVRLARKLVSTVGRVDYARVQIHGNEATPMAIGGASILSSTTRSDGFVIVPSDSEGFPEGAEVEVFLY